MYTLQQSSGGQLQDMKISTNSNKKEVRLAFNEAMFRPLSHMKKYFGNIG